MVPRSPDSYRLRSAEGIPAERERVRMARGVRRLDAVPMADREVPMRRLFIIAGLAAGAFFAWKKLTGRTQGDFLDEGFEHPPQEAERPAPGTV